MGFGPKQAHRKATGSPIGAAAFVMTLATLARVFGHADIKGAVGAFEEVDVEHN